MGRRRNNDYDFVGWATVYNNPCDDGRTIMDDAFVDDDGKEVPLVWNHQHGGVDNVLGKVLLHAEPGGIRAYGKFDDSREGKAAKRRVINGSLSQLSIFANKLKESAGNVYHGKIREVSLVLAGANDGAVIDHVLAHGASGEYEYTPDAGIIYSGEDIEVLCHSVDYNEEESYMYDNEYGRSTEEIIDDMTDEQKAAVLDLVDGIQGMYEDEYDGEDDYDEDEYDDEEYDDDEDDYDEYDDEEYDYDEGEDMKHNAFDDGSYGYEGVLLHDALNEAFNDMARYGSLKESVKAHMQDTDMEDIYLAHDGIESTAAMEGNYGIKGIEWLNPEPHELNNTPQWINHYPLGWVDTVVGGVHHLPFQNVKMTFADITADEARARGYIKGTLKKDEVFSLLKRSISPTTIYKKQKFDRDDLIDADFDIVPWVKAEMKQKLKEEKARAYIFGDGRTPGAEGKVDETKIIPVVKDHDLFTIKYTVTPKQNESLEHAIIDGAVMAQDDYQGSGNTVAFLEQKQVTKMLLMEDQFGHRLYKNLTDLAAAMGVNKIEKVPASFMPNDIYGVILDLSDYAVGQKNLGQQSMFDDFDIDYNQQKYLIEERQSGGLTKPYSAIVLKKAEANG